VRTFGDYYLGVILRPRRTFDALMTDSRRLKFGLMALAINIMLYSLVYIFLTIGGGAPGRITPWLAIAPEDYYYYNRFLLAPSMVACWILAAGVAQLLSRLFSGKGSFEDNLSVLGFAISVSSLASLLHDLPDTFLGAIGVINLREYEIALNSPTIWRTILWVLYTLYAVLFVVLFPKSIGAAQQLKRLPGIVVGVLAFLVYQLVFFTFNR
jgi:hypothetical protein